METVVRALQMEVEKADANLRLASQRLEAEFQTRAEATIDPMKLLHRIQKLREGVKDAHNECEQLMATKQEFFDTAVKSLLSVHTNLQELRDRTCGAETISAPTTTAVNDIRKLETAFANQIYAFGAGGRDVPCLSSSALNLAVIKSARARSASAVVSRLPKPSPTTGRQFVRGRRTSMRRGRGRGVQ